MRAPRQAALARVLEALPPGAELSIDDPTVDDGALEARRTACGFECKRGRHGCAGEWRAATPEAAFGWLWAGVETGREAVLALWLPHG